MVCLFIYFRLWNFYMAEKLVSVNLRIRIPTVKLKIPGKLFLNPDPEFLLNSSYSFDLGYLPVAAVGT